MEFLRRRRHTEESREEYTALPDSLMKKSAEFIISRVGKDSFERYITYEGGVHYRSTKCSPECTHWYGRSRYLLGFRLRVPERPFVDELIEFTVDSAGNVIGEAPMRGLPDCVTNPGECDFQVDEARAIEIAKEAGLEPGIKEWTAAFGWFGGEYQTYAWSIQNTLSGSGPDVKGKGLAIDANSGELLEEYLYEGME